LLRLGQSGGKATAQMDADSQERISLYLHALSNPTPEVQQLCLVHCREAFTALLQERMATEAADAPQTEVLEVNRQTDDLISVRQLKGKGASDGAAIDFEEDDDTSLSKATGAVPSEDFALRLKRVTQLTGLSDPIYAEAYVTVHSYDILLDFLLINTTSEPMHNVCLELATVGDLKLCERPQSYSLAAGEHKHIKSNIKVSSTETGIVFGTIVYDTSSTAAATNGATPTGAAASADAKSAVVLNDIHIDIMDYISPAYCSDLAFRAMWAEFEWENKVAVNTDLTDVNAFLEHVVKATNMRCLTPSSALEGESGFLAANLYAKSIFGEDALVNVSVERREGAGAASKICGYIRIRSKTQGIALSLGDKITLKQKTAAS